MTTAIAIEPVMRRTRYALPVVPEGITRTMDATFLNTVANHPDVRPWLGGVGVLDLTASVTDPRNIAAVSEHGGFVAIEQGVGRYEVHSLFLPAAGRGEAVRAMRAAVDYFFTATDGVELVTKVPLFNKAAKGLTLLAGFAPLFVSRIPWGDRGEETEFFTLTMDRWALRAAVTAEYGRWLHETMADALASWGSRLPQHSDEDETHDRISGAAVLMVREGNAKKAVRFYNQYARFTGYPPIELVRECPTVLDLGGLIVEARWHEMEILSCQ